MLSSRWRVTVFLWMILRVRRIITRTAVSVMRRKRRPGRRPARSLTLIVLVDLLSGGRLTGVVESIHMEMPRNVIIMETCWEVGTIIH